MLLLDAGDLGGDLVAILLFLFGCQIFVVFESILPLPDLPVALIEVLRKLRHLAAALLALVRLLLR